MRDCPPMSLSKLLATQNGAVLTRYLREMRSSLVAPEMSDSEILDSLARYLGELSVELEQGRPEGNPNAAAVLHANATAVEHGSQRLDIGFDVVSVARDYHLLHGCILDVVEENGITPTMAEHRSLVRYMGAAAARAVEHYQRLRDRQQERQAAEHLGFLAHELRNPLGSVRMAFDLLRKAELAKGGKAVEVLDRSLKSTIDLIDQSLVATRLTTLSVDQREQVNLTELLTDAREDSQVDAAARKLEVKVDVDTSLSVSADVRLLRSLITNLLRNAVKFSHPGGVIILRAHRHEDQTILEVEDSCGGIAPDTIARVFDPHVQVGKDRSGFGLGLAIAKRAAEAHSGTLQVHNLDGKGCVFRLSLPSNPPQFTSTNG